MAVLDATRERDGSTKEEGDGRVSSFSSSSLFSSFSFSPSSLLSAPPVFVGTWRDAKIYDRARAKKSRREKARGSLVKTSQLFLDGRARVRPQLRKRLTWSSASEVYSVSDRTNDTEQGTGPD